MDTDPVHNNSLNELRAFLQMLVEAKSYATFGQEQLAALDALIIDRDRLNERVKELEGWIDKGESPMLHAAREQRHRAGVGGNEL